MNKIEILEYEVETSVCNWIEVKIKHKKINKKFIKMFIPEFKKLPFVYDAYKADNGLIRLNMIGNENRINPFLYKDIPDDICIHIHKGYFVVIGTMGNIVPIDDLLLNIPKKSKILNNLEPSKFIPSKRYGQVFYEPATTALPKIEEFLTENFKRD